VSLHNNPHLSPHILAPVRGTTKNIACDDDFLCGHRLIANVGLLQLRLVAHVGGRVTANKALNAVSGASKRQKAVPRTDSHSDHLCAAKCGFHGTELPVQKHRSCRKTTARGHRQGAGGEQAGSRRAGPRAEWWSRGAQCLLPPELTYTQALRAAEPYVASSSQPLRTASIKA